LSVLPGRFRLLLGFKVRTFRDLEVWKRSHAVVKQLYLQTQRFPEVERFGLTTQLRRAAVSVPANVAEGCRRPTRTDYARHVGIAEGSLSEVDYFVELASDLGYMNASIAASLRSEIAEIMKMLTSLRLRLLSVDVRRRPS
jgi:four helix bundle protein